MGTSVNGMIPMGLPSFNNAKAMITTSKSQKGVNDYKKTTGNRTSSQMLPIYYEFLAKWQKV
jgi:hypothetical protein